MAVPPGTAYSSVIMQMKAEQFMLMVKPQLTAFLKTILPQMVEQAIKSMHHGVSFMETMLLKMVEQSAEALFSIPI